MISVAPADFESTALRCRKQTRFRQTNPLRMSQNDKPAFVISDGCRKKTASYPIIRCDRRYRIVTCLGGFVAQPLCEVTKHFVGQRSTNGPDRRHFWGIDVKLPSIF